MMDTPEATALASAPAEPATPPTPNLDRMMERRADLDAASDFYEFLGEHGVYLVRYDALGNSYLAESIGTLLARWIGVDEAALEEERRAALKLIAAAQSR